MKLTKKEIMDIIMEELENLQEGDPEDRALGESHLQHIKKEKPLWCLNKAFKEPKSSREPESEVDAMMRQARAMAYCLANMLGIVLRTDNTTNVLTQ